MATNSNTSMENLPPKRGKIKTQIFKKMKEMVVFIASKVRKVFEIHNNKGDDRDGSSTSATPPPSDNNSDVNSSISG